jgi:hypothetical protein
MPIYRSTIIWRDVKGNVAKTVFYSNSVDLAAAVTTAQGVLVACAAVSNCAVQGFHGPGEDPVIGPVWGTGANYCDVEDKAALTFVTGSSVLGRFEIPAPKDPMFYADRETINPANIGIPTLIAAFTDGSTCTRGGQVYVSYLGGTRKRRKAHRRISILNTNPALNGPA